MARIPYPDIIDEVVGIMTDKLINNGRVAFFDNAHGGATAADIKVQPYVQSVSVLQGAS